MSRLPSGPPRDWEREARELRWTLIQVQRAFERRDRGALANAPELAQPLVDAAMRWIIDAEGGSGVGVATRPAEPNTDRAQIAALGARDGG